MTTLNRPCPCRPSTGFSQRQVSLAGQHEECGDTASVAQFIGHARNSRATVREGLTMSNQRIDLDDLAVTLQEQGQTVAKW